MFGSIRRAVTTPADPTRLDQVDQELFDDLLPWVDRARKLWFRLDVRGMERVPEGAALVVANHNSGITFVEAMGSCARYFRANPGAGMGWRGLAHDAMVDMPVVGNLLVKVGTLRAGHETASRTFSEGYKVFVCPGGNREAFRKWSDRNKIQFGDRRGFVRLAIRHQVPIVPMVHHGGHSGLLVLRDGKRFAKWSGAKKVLRTDTWPIFIGMPWGLMVGPMFHIPLPVKCTTEFLDPIPVDAYTSAQADDPEAVEAVFTQVVDAMQRCLDRLAAE